MQVMMKWMMDFTFYDNIENLVVKGHACDHTIQRLCAQLCEA